MSVVEEEVGPVAVGGVGGSGTRVIASLVSSFGFDMGPNLNRAHDDLTFTVLFKRPEDYPEVRGLIPATHPKAVAATELFVAVRTGRRGVGSEVLPLVRASLSIRPDQVDQGPSRLVTPTLRRARRLRRLDKVFRHRGPASGAWTWKEPNTLVFVPTLFATIPRLRYIHVVRNGLSMAESKNDYQLKNWGFLFGVPDDSRAPGLKQLVYWARANLAVSEYLSTQSRSLLVSHEQTVREPMGVAEQIAAFLGRPVTEETRRVVAQVRRPDDFDRAYQPADGLAASEADEIREALGRFGYAVPF